MYKSYNGQNYKVMDQSEMNIAWGEHYTDKFIGSMPSITSDEEKALRAYSKGSDAKIRKALSEGGKESNNNSIKKYIKDIDSSMEKYVLGNNIVLSRRVSVRNKEAAEFFWKFDGRI